MNGLVTLAVIVSIIGCTNSQWLNRRTNRSPQRAYYGQYPMQQNPQQRSPQPPPMKMQPPRQMPGVQNQRQSAQVPWANGPHSQYPNQQGQQLSQQSPTLVDYPFTVEFVDRNNRREEDKNLVDYPFVIEFRDNENARGRNNNNDGRGQPSLQPRPPSPFQSTGQHYNQQRPQYQHNHQQFGRNNGGVNGGSMNFLNNGNGGFVGGAGDCRLVKCGS